MFLNSDEKNFLRAVFSEFPLQNEFSPKALRELADRHELNRSVVQRFLGRENQIKWGMYTIEPFRQYANILTNENVESTVSIPQANPTEQTMLEVHRGNPHVPSVNMPTSIITPEKDPGFVSWGFYKDIKEIIRSRQFFPVFISGLSGSGKTIFVRQACAELKRGYIRIQITSETDESDLLGSWRLENGNTVWVDGPIVTAAKTGSICLIDEIDRSSSRIASLLGILEGQPILIKKTGEIIHPKEGFNIIATGNTKGRGSETGKYTFAVIIDDALLERFLINYDQSFPNEKTIKKILETYTIKVLNKELDTKYSEFIEYLSKWVSIIYKTFENEAIEDIISIRRAVQILRIYSLFEDTSKAIRLGISRFDQLEQDAFFDLFSKVSDINITKEEEEKDQSDNEDVGKTKDGGGDSDPLNFTNKWAREFVSSTAGF